MCRWKQSPLQAHVSLEETLARLITLFDEYSPADLSTNKIREFFRKWRARQDSNLRSSASKARCLNGYTKRLYPLGDSRSRFAGIGRLFGHLRRFIASLPITVPIALLLSGHAEPSPAGRSDPRPQTDLPPLLQLSDETLERIHADLTQPRDPGASPVSVSASSDASWPPACRGGLERIVWSLQTQPCQTAPNPAASRLRIDADR